LLTSLLKALRYGGGTKSGTGAIGIDFSTSVAAGSPANAPSTKAPAWAAYKATCDKTPGYRR